MTKPAISIDAKIEESRITSFIQRIVASSRAAGVVVGVSGGVDSGVVGALCVRALGSERVLCALLPSRHTPQADIDDAVRMVADWGARSVTIRISQVVDDLISAVGQARRRLPGANVQARVRMTILYYLANSRNLLVAGTGDRSEELLGFFTKFGDGGADFLPIAHLFKTQVRAMAEHLGLPTSVARKPASPQLWPGHTAEEELPAGYEKLDAVLHWIFDERASTRVASESARVEASIVERVMNMYSMSAHKRAQPPALRPRSGKK
ncbi:MAG TPA: NAD+ synthase [Nitrososphaerales archaeon]|nr:NAD+ synthase [Nitrososphaerales archaeon]